MLTHPLQVLLPPLPWVGAWLETAIQGRNRHIFLRGQSHFPWFFFPGVKCFFPAENSHFGRPKTNFRRFQKWKAKKKKKGSSPLFITFPTSISYFPLSLLQFSFFSCQFSPLFPFFLASFFPIRQQKFPNQKSRGDTLPPACYTTAAIVFTTVSQPQNDKSWTIIIEDTEINHKAAIQIWLSPNHKTTHHG